MVRTGIRAMATVLVAALFPLVAPVNNAVAEPDGLYVDLACPGSVTYVQEQGLPDGVYLLHSDVGTLIANHMSVQGGRQTHSGHLLLPDDPPSSFTVTASDVTGRVVSTLVRKLDPSTVQQFGLDVFATQSAVGECWAPDERVDVTWTGTDSERPFVFAGEGEPPGFEFTFENHPHEAPSTASAVFTGEKSKRVVAYTLGEIGGTTLMAGHSLTYPTGPSLLSPSVRAQLRIELGTLSINEASPTDPLDIRAVWQVGHDPARSPGSHVDMQTDGNLVVYSGLGKELWSSGTAGTGSDNRIVMKDNGNLVMYTADGTAIWSSQAGLIGPPNNLHAFARAAATRVGSAVYINGQVNQAAASGDLVHAIGRTAYLQRYINGAWQNMLVRQTNSAGHLTVGFTQRTVFQYRLVVVPSSTGAAARSASVFR